MGSLQHRLVAQNDPTHKANEKLIDGGAAIVEALQ